MCAARRSWATRSTWSSRSPRHALRASRAAASWNRATPSTTTAARTCSRTPRGGWYEAATSPPDPIDEAGAHRCAAVDGGAVIVGHRNQVEDLTAGIDVWRQGG